MLASPVTTTVMGIKSPVSFHLQDFNLGVPWDFYKKRNCFSAMSL